MTWHILALLAAVAVIIWALPRRKSRKGSPVLRVLAGQHPDGQQRTNATWFHHSRGDHAVLHRSGRAIGWWHLPQAARAGITWTILVVAVSIWYGLDRAPTLTMGVLAAAVALLTAGLAFAVTIAARNWRHERHFVRPVERTVTAKIKTPPDVVQVTRDSDGNVTSVEIEWPATAEIGPQEKQLALEAVTTRLPLEAPDEAWNLRGRNRRVTFTQSEPPPFPVSWDDVAPAVQRATPDELVFGVGKRSAITVASYGQSPHLTAPGGSGGGKSNLAAFLLLQEMIRGSLIVNLDPKWISHLWMQDLPNVINAHDIPDLHVALDWLGRELLRRTRAAWYSAQGTGRVHGTTGARIIVLAEELNYGMPGLKNHWREIRGKTDPKQSPAIAGLSALSCAGRASDIHLYLIAQLLTVASTGVSDSTIRTNAGIKAMTRWDEPGWKMAVGKHVPMPPPPEIPGRIQLVTGNACRETQVPWLHLDDDDPDVADKAVAWARDLAVSGTIAQIPSGPEGVPPQLWPASVLRQHQTAIIPAQPPPGPETVAVLVTLRQACDTGTLPMTLIAARKAAQRPGFPPAAGRDGRASLYDQADLAAWQHAKGTP